MIAVYHDLYFVNLRDNLLQLPQMEIIQRITNVFSKTFGSAPTYIARAPGRVNLLGEHVDYNDGFVLPAAIDRATYIAFSPTDSHQTTLVAADLDQLSSFSPQTIPSKTQTDSSPLPDWAHYPAGVMWALLEDNLAAPALNAVYASNVPRGSGLSSSASVEMAFMTTWQ